MVTPTFYDKEKNLTYSGGPSPEKNIEIKILDLEGDTCVDIATTAAILFKKEDLVNIGLFDEDFFIYYPDFEIGRRIKDYNKSVIQVFDAKAIHVMGNSLLYWTQKLYEESLLASGSRVVGLTSECNYLAMEGYGPVSVAKVAMEAIIRQIGWELGKVGITANAVQAGVTPTRALTKITDRWESWVEKTKKRNPMRRTTTPKDVAGVISLLLNPEADFINCSIIYCDGGESRSGAF